jgi:tetratricopeptide (TPR) repeat protein
MKNMQSTTTLVSVRVSTSFVRGVGGSRSGPVKTWLWASPIACACVLLVSQPARAQRPARDTREVTRLLREGTAAFEVHDDGTALTSFQQAYRLSEEPTILVNVGRVLARMRRYDEAIATFRRFLDIVPNAPERPAIESLIRDVQAQRDAEQRRGETASSTSDRTPAPNPPPPPLPGPSPAPLSGPPIGGWILLGGGLALSAASIIPWMTLRVPGLSTLDRATMTGQCVPTGAAFQCTDVDGSLEASYRQAQLGTTLFGVFIGTGLAVAIGGAIWIAAHPRHRPPPVSVSLSPLGGISLSGHFGGSS